MQFNKQVFLLLASLSVSTTGFVIPSGRGSAFGLSTRSFSAVFSEATDDAAPTVEAAVDASAEVVVTPPEEKFTIYVSNVPFTIEDKDVVELFSKCGTVKDVSIPRRKDSSDSRGFAFIEMASRDEMEKAVEELDGIELGGRAIQARVSLPKDKLPTKATREKPTTGRRPRGPDGPKIYVGNLPYGVAEDDLKELFAEHGEVVSVYLVKDDDGKDRGFGFITMANDEAVDVAVAKIDGSFFQGRRLAARRPLAEGEKSEQAAPQSDVERIYFGNLSFETTEETMRAMFEQHGKVLNLFINQDFATGSSRGYGFAQMLKQDAPKAIEALNGLEVDGREIRVTVSEDKMDKMKIYCGSLSFDSAEKTIRDLFSAYGKVFSIYLPEDKEYGGSRGFAIVTMAADGGAKAIQELDGAEVDGRKIRVNEAKPKGAAGTASSTTKLYVGNLDFDTTAETLRDAFAEYGDVKDCTLPEDRDFGGSRGFGFVVMDAEDAKVALAELDGIELDGRVIRVTEADGRKGSRNTDSNSGEENYSDEVEQE